MTITRERRRNMRADWCRVCRAEVPAYAGWLYRDTNSKTTRRNINRFVRFGWFVKCDGCHAGGETTTTHAMKKAAERRGPAPAKVGVGDLRAARFRPSTFPCVPWTEACVELVLPDGAAEIVAQLRPITCEPIGVGGSYGAGAPCFGGRVLTPAAEKELANLGVYAADIYELYLSCPREAE